MIQSLKIKREENQMANSAVCQKPKAARKATKPNKRDITNQIKVVREAIQTQSPATRKNLAGKFLVS